MYFQDIINQKETRESTKLKVEWTLSSSTLVSRISRAVAWIAAGVAVAATIHAGLGSLSAEEQIRVLAALAAGFGVVHLWMAFDGQKAVSRVVSGILGSAILVIAVSSLPGNPAFVGAAYLLGAIASLASTERSAPLLLASGGGLATLAVLSVA